MKIRSKLQYAGVIAAVALFSSGMAQACMPAMLGQQATPGCTAAKGGNESCPLQGQRAEQSRSCAGDKQELMQSMGSVAMSGMEMAAQMMRAVSEGMDTRASVKTGS